MNPFQRGTARAGFIVAQLVVVTSALAAQLAPPSGSSQGSRANQLPLSGAGAQSGSVVSTQAPVPGTTSSVNTLNPSLEVSGSYAGSINGVVRSPFSGRLSLGEAIQRGLAYNLGAESIAQATRQAQGQAKAARSALLPNLAATASETEQQTNLTVAGLRFKSSIPGLSIPSIVGPFNYFDLRAHLTQIIGDRVAWQNYRVAQEIDRSNAFTMKDARDLVVLAVGGSYLQAVAAKARLASAKAQLETATALYQQASQQRGVGLLAQTDVNRSRIQVLTEQERLETLRNDFAKQKINLARMTGLPPNDEFELSDDVPYSAAPAITLEEALQQAFANRQDLKAANAQVRASELTRSAARAELLPSLALNADYGVNGINPNQSHGTFSATATLTVPIWRGGQAQGDMEQARAEFSERRAELEDLHAKVESDVRNAYLDLQAATNQLSVASENLRVNRETLELTRQKFQAGVSDNVEVVQAQESVANAELDYINSVLGHNLAKLSLARAVGDASGHWSQFLKLP
jgi:outer membrane protein TolC